MKMEDRRIIHQNIQASNIVVRDGPQTKPESVFLVDFASAVDLGKRTGHITGDANTGKAIMMRQATGNQSSSSQVGFKIDAFCVGLLCYEL